MIRIKENRRDDLSSDTHPADASPVPESPLPRPSLALARTLVEQAPFPIIITDIHSGQMLYVNNAGIRLVGRAPLPMEAEQKCYQYAFGLDAPCERCPRNGLSETELSKSFFKVTNFGDHTYALHSMQADWNGIAANVGYVTDISSIVSSYGAVQAATEGIPAGIGTYRIFRDHAQIVYANKMLRELMGMKGDDCKYDEADIFSRVPEEESEGLLKSIITFAYADAGSDLLFTVNIKNDDGMLSSYLCRGAVVHPEGSEPLVRLVVTETTAAHDRTSDSASFISAVLQAGSGSESVFWLYDIESKTLRILGQENPETPSFTPPRVYQNVPESIVGSGFVHNEDASKYLQAYSDIREGKKTAEWTMRMRTFMKDASFCHVRCKLVRYTDTATGRAMAVGSMAKTDAPPYEALTVNTPGIPVNAHILSLENGRISFKKYDPSLARIMGYPGGRFPAEFERDVMPIIHPDDRAQYFAFVTDVSTSDKKQCLDYRVLASDGTVYTIHDTSIAVEDPDFGRVIYSDFSVKDASVRPSVTDIDASTLSKALMTLNSQLVSANITANRYRFVDTSQRTYTKIPPEGSLDELVATTAQHIPKEERQTFYRKFSREALLRAYSEGVRKVSLEHRILTSAGIALMINSTVVFIDRTVSSDDVRCIVLTRDVTAEYKERVQLQTDGLSGLSCRAVFESMVEYRLNSHVGLRCAFILADLDSLKLINDTGGHRAGDAAIAHMAQALRDVMPEGSVLGRVGGDEFGVFLCPAPPRSEMELILQDIIEKVSEHRIAGLENRPLTCSLGCFMTFAAKDGRDEMQARADGALYAVKHAGRNGYNITVGM